MSLLEAAKAILAKPPMYAKRWSTFDGFCVYCECLMGQLDGKGHHAPRCPIRALQEAVAEEEKTTVVLVAEDMHIGDMIDGDW